MEQSLESPLKKRNPLNLLVFFTFSLVLFGWLWNTPEGLLGKADAVGYAVCHRIDVRSFHLGDRPISLCARCTGMYLGAILGLLFQGITAPRRGKFPPKRVLAILTGMVAVFGLDGLNSFAHLIPGLPTLYQANNTLRILTGTGFGIVMAAAVYPVFSQTVWKRWEEEPAIPGFRQLALLLIFGMGIAFLVMTENPIILYPLALISAGGVLIVLALVYTMLWLIALKAENRYDRPWQLVTPLIGGLTMALLQIALLDLGRFLLTGTWEGFHVLLG
jgi:uncharacterized membrane protein